MTQVETLPKHIAIIMDGNGRWAKARGLPRFKGHQEGAESVSVITEECARRKIQQLTLYAFSTENWKRPKREVSFVMRLLQRYLVNERKRIMKNNIRFATIGGIEALPEGVQREMAVTKRESAGNTGMVLCLALNYGSRSEIVRAAQRFAADALAGRRAPDSLDETVFSSYLDTAGMSDPDLLIRTAGEMRLSNFLLWQISYAELYVTPVLWPDFRETHLAEALTEYARRERRYGGIAATSNQ